MDFGDSEPVIYSHTGPCEHSCVNRTIIFLLLSSSTFLFFLPILFLLPFLFPNLFLLIILFLFLLPFLFLLILLLLLLSSFMILIVLGGLTDH